MVFKRFANVWTKLRAFELIEYDRVVLVDSDMLVRQNMDELMDWPLDTSAHPTIAAGFACTCNPNRIATYPDDWCVVLCAYDRIPENCAFSLQRHPINHSQPLSITSDSPRTHHLLNSGLVVLEPTQKQAESIHTFLHTERERVATYRFPDQDLLADLYYGRFSPLPWVYNALKKLPKCHAQLWRDEEVRNVHYILDKPWDVGWPGPAHEDEDAHLHGWWWDAYRTLQNDPAQVGLSNAEWQEWITANVNDAPRSRQCIS